MARKLMLLVVLVAFGAVTFGCQSTGASSVTGQDQPIKYNDKGRVLH